MAKSELGIFILPETNLLFGQDLKLTAFTSNPSRLEDEKLIWDLLNILPEKLEMTKIAPPIVKRHEAKNPEDLEIAGLVLIAESHIFVNSFPNRGFVWVDAFSCKPFDPNLVVEEVKQAFDVENGIAAISDRTMSNNGLSERDETQVIVF